MKKRYFLLILLLISIPFLLAKPSFSTIFVSIVLEGLPFIVLGSILASLIHVYLPDGFLEKNLPKNNFLAVIVASLLGIIFPVCECSIVPVIRKLTNKGMPINIAVTFLLSAPIVNPIVLLSTYYAFGNSLKVVLLRALIGIFVAITIGYFLTGMKKETYLKEKHSKKESGCGCSHCDHHHHDHHKVSKFGLVIDHSIGEFFDIGKYYIMGVFFASLFQTFLPHSILFGIGNSFVLSIIFMMVFAYVLSVCSESDAFIARSFQGTFTSGSIMSFITFGPMLDLKNTLMLFHSFKRKFVYILMILITVENFIIAIIINLLEKFGGFLL